MSSRSIKRRKLTPPSQEVAADFTTSVSGEIESSDEAEDASIASGLSQDTSSGDDVEMDDRSQMEEEPIEASHLPVNAKSSSSEANGKISSTQTSRQSQQDTLKEAAYTSGSFKSNVFKLQVDELLEQIRFRPLGKKSTASRHLQDLIATIEAVPAQKPISLAEATKAFKKQGVSVPFPDPQPETNSNLKFHYSPAKRVEVIGNYAAELSVRTQDGVTVDIGVEVPATVYDSKDYLDYRYFYKRSCLLAQLAASIKKHDSFDCRFDYLDGNYLLPLLLVTPRTDSASGSARPKVQFRVLPAYPDGTFVKDKLLPSANCSRDERTSAGLGDTLARSAATPFYNAAVQVDGLHWSYMDLQQKTSARCVAYRDTCLLGQVWLRQRGFSDRIEEGGFGPSAWSILTAMLLQGGGSGGRPLFSPGYSSFQLFKAILQLFVTKDLVKSPLIVGGSSPRILDENPYGIPYLFDAARGHNLLYRMTSWSYKDLQLAAKATLAALADSNFDNFGSTFVSKANAPILKSDFSINIPVGALLGSAKHFSKTRLLDQRCHDVYDALTRGLADRARSILDSTPLKAPWELEDTPTSIEQHSHVSFYIVFDPTNAQRKIDHGPSAEDKQEAAEFRKFWGDKAELRRFNDGRILETLVWSDKAADRSVFHTVVEHILLRHYGEDVASRAEYIGGCESTVMKRRGAKGLHTYSAFGPLREAFRRFGEDLRALEDLPLTIRNIVPADSQLGATSLQIPLAGNVPMSQPASVVLQFEGSGRWPDDLAAIQRTKIAFLIRTGELLEAHVEGLEARMGLEDQHTPLVNEAYLDVFYPTGAAFRLRIMHEREQVLLERRLKLPSATSQEKAEAATALARYKRDFVRQPAHVQAMQSLCSRFEALPATISLLKAWFASQLLSPYFSPAVIELFAAQTFVNPAPWSTPSSGATGFLRCLVRLSRWDWRNEPWLVMMGETQDPLLNANGADDETARADVATIRTRFEAWRKIDPQLHRVVMFVASDIDSDGSTWTDRALPPKVVASRMTGLARAAAQVITESGTSLELSSLFVPDLQDYDLVIHLKKSSAGLQRQSSKTGKYKNLQVQENLSTARERAGSNAPAQLLVDDLRASFGDVLLFFFDAEAADCVAAIWDPTLDKRAWKVRASFSTIPSETKALAMQNGIDSNGSEMQVVADINKAAILNDIARLGGDMIRKVEVTGSQ